MRAAGEVFLADARFQHAPRGASCLEYLRNGKTIGEVVLNLGFTDWDAHENVVLNRRRWMKALRAGNFAMSPLRQFHSDAVRIAESPRKPAPAESPAPRGDALITQTPRLLLSVQTADCVPILLADPEHRAVAAIHAGWRGTVRRIAGKTVGRMRMAYASRPEKIVAALGPCIGGCCYEVGPDVAREFASQFPDAAKWFDEVFEKLAWGEDPNPLPWLNMMPPGHQPEPPRTRLDLQAANRAILVEAGLRDENIFSCPFCTSCRADLFFSYRRERQTGRLMASIGIG